MNKYTYYKVIQENHGFGWDDSDFHETDSSFCFKTKKNTQKRVNYPFFLVYWKTGLLIAHYIMVSIYRGLLYL